MTVTDEQLDTWGAHLLRKCESGSAEMKLYLRFLKGVARRQDREEDSIIAVSGPKGRGKSSFAIVSCLILRQLGIGFGWDHVCCSANDMGKQVEDVGRSVTAAFIVDEAIRSAYSRNAMSAVNKDLAIFTNTVRKRMNIWFWCIPKFMELDPALRDGTVNFWVEVFWKSKDQDHDRKFAKASLFVKDENTFTNDPWGVEEERTRYIKSRRIAVTPGELLKSHMRCKTYTSPLEFPALPLPLEKEYKGDSFTAIENAGKLLGDKLSGKKPEAPHAAP